MAAAHGAQRLPVDALVIAIAIKRQAQFIQTQVESHQYQRDDRQPEQDGLPDRRALLLPCLRDRLVRCRCCCHTLFSSFPCNFTPHAGQPPSRAAAVRRAAAEQGSTKQGSAEQGSGKGWPYYIRMQARLLEPRPCRVGLPPEAFTSGRPRPPARGGPTRDDRSTSGTTASSIVGPPLAGGLRGARTGFSERFWGQPLPVACGGLARASVTAYKASPCRWPAWRRHELQ